MLDEKEIIDKLQKSLTTKRFGHSMRVVDTALKLAKIYNCDLKKTKIAAMLHDCAKCYECDQSLELCQKYNVVLDDQTSKGHQLIHAVLGAKIAEIEYGVDDSEILSAIACHTTGKANMTMLDKIIWLADYIEPARDFEDIDKIRELAYTDINKSILFAFEKTLEFLIAKGKDLHPSTKSAKESIVNEENK